MKHLSQQMISMELRRPHLRRRRRHLQKQLHTPTLDPENRRRLERELQGLGDPKVYSAEDPPLPGALNPGSMPMAQIEISPDSTYEQVSSLPHTRLYLFALQEELDVHPGNTKAQIVQTILAHLRREGATS